MTPTLRPALLAALLALPAAAMAQPAPLTTHAERSGFIQTGRYDEVTRLCEAFAARYPGRVRCETFGTTPEGRRMHVLADYGEVEFFTSRPAVTTPAPGETIYRAPSPEGDVVVTVTEQPCEDVMSGERSPRTVLLAFGGRELRGCGR